MMNIVDEGKFGEYVGKDVGTHGNEKWNWMLSMYCMKFAYLKY
jgi:hypothetical protein